ncbi:hypothetical protein [Glutamicibacter uratoxydans]|uniref:hypothetical protein n=1 Tax=Glutamicibacter uratoxydans TaxID=43667 RepID=UPI003D6DD885
MQEHPRVLGGQSIIGEVLAAASDGDYPRVLEFAPLVLDQADQHPDVKDLWLVLDAWGTAAHAVDDYALMKRVAELMIDIARQAQSTEYEILALLERSTAERCAFEHQASLNTAQLALRLARELPQDSPDWVRIYQVIMAALVEIGDLDQAWSFHTDLASSLRLVAASQEQAKGYWTLGNLAFMVGKPAQGVQYHQQAASLMTPANDMLMWARFNRASAEFRLQADITDEATLDCLKRAKLAFMLIEPGDLDAVGLALTESRMLSAQRQDDQALERLERFTAQYSGEPVHLVPLLQWWAELLESRQDWSGAEDKRAQATRISTKGH